MTGLSHATIVLDVNETLSDLAPMRRVFAGLGAPEYLAPSWFASLLRDGFARLVTGEQEQFSVVAAAAARVLLADQPLTVSLDDAVAQILDGFLTLPVHPDVPEGLRALTADGHTVVTLTNGSVEVSERLLAGAGVREQVDRLIAAQDVGQWKPAPGAYQYAARVCGAELASMMLVAVHPWDIDGAAKAGMRTAWIDRHGTPYPEHFRAPDYHVADLAALAPALHDG